MTITFITFVIWSAVMFWLGSTWNKSRGGCVTALLAVIVFCATILAAVVVFSFSFLAGLLI